LLPSMRTCPTTRVIMASEAEDGDWVHTFLERCH
jgi:hypothetical protein